MSEHPHFKENILKIDINQYIKNYDKLISLKKEPPADNYGRARESKVEKTNRRRWGLRNSRIKREKIRLAKEKGIPPPRLVFKREKIVDDKEDDINFKKFNNDLIKIFKLQE
ncbi:hypothetical protein CPAV1605_1276 [seawater metagenome]|uniref:Uncharacterized protein n=1 Tax=seawater metagenome TaxID=1561972 RepID=A0A5E8CM03_9ZZZZ